MRQLMDGLEKGGDVHGALQLAHQAVRADPLREEICRDLMRLLAAAGQAAAGLRQYEALARRLERDLGATPDEETDALAAELARRVRAGPAVLKSMPAWHEAGSPPMSAARRPDVSRPSSLPTGTVVLVLAEMAEEAPATRQSGGVKNDWELLCSCLTGHGGLESDSAGGLLRVAFGRTSVALAAALAARGILRQQGGHGDSGVRWALHVGEVEPGVSLQESPAMAHASRLLLAAHAGQILLSERAVALLRGDATTSVRLQDLGLYCLAPGQPPERLFHASGPGEPQHRFPPPNAVPASLGYLPLSFTRFFGREEEIARLHDLLQVPGTRLVTLTGPGGSGKTRLALEVARSIDARPWSALSFVPLVDLIDPQRIPEQVLTALRIPRAPEIEALDQVVAVLSSPHVTGSGRTLLVLDNFEHLPADGADIIQTLLERLPSLTCLITSRRPLHLEAEQEVSVRPLPAPPGPDDPADLIRCAGVQIFVDRAQAVRPDFQLTAANAAAVAAVCRYLEGIPLAIELAAARAQVLTPGQMLAQMADRFDLLVSRRRGTHWRHQSLRATLDWSFQLLPPPLQQLLARLSVFRGGWTLEAAEAVCGDGVGWWVVGGGSETEHPPPTTHHLIPTLDHLAQLRDCSLVLADESAGEMRFGMLETVREYARQQLDREEAARVQRRHAEYYLALAERAEPELEGAEQGLWLARLEREHDNFRVALSWAEESETSGTHGEPFGPDNGAVSLRLSAALGPFWDVRGHSTEGRRWLEGALARSSGGSKTSGAARARALAVAGKFTWRQGDPETARACCEESVALARELADKRQLIRSLFTLGWVTVYPGDLATAMDYQKECHALSRELGDRSGLALSLLLRVRVAFSGDPGGARFDLEESLALFRKLGNKRMIAVVAGDLANIASWQGDDQLAWAYQEEVLAIFRELGDPWGIARGLRGLGRIAVSRAELGAAHSYYQEALTVLRQLVDRWHTHGLLTSLGVVNWLQGDYEAARQCLEEALALKRDRGPRLESAVNLHFLGEVAMAQGRWMDARALFEEAHAIDTEHGIRGGLASGARGRAAMKLGDWDEARRIFEADLAIKRELGDQRAIATNLHDLGNLCVHEGEYQTACSFAKESLAIRQKLADKLGICASLELLAAAATGQDQARRAARLFGAAEGLRQEIGAPLPPSERADYERRRQAMSAALGEGDFAAAWTEGRALALDEGVELALAEAPGTRAR